MVGEAPDLLEALARDEPRFGDDGTRTRAEDRRAPFDQIDISGERGERLRQRIMEREGQAAALLLVRVEQLARLVARARLRLSRPLRDRSRPQSPDRVGFARAPDRFHDGTFGHCGSLQPQPAYIFPCLSLPPSCRGPALALVATASFPSKTTCCHGAASPGASAPGGASSPTSPMRRHPFTNSRYSPSAIVQGRA